MELAIIETGGKQYVVRAGQTLDIEKLPVDPKGSVTFDRVLLIAGDSKLAVGAPYVKDATVTAICEIQGKTKKVTGMKFHNKTRYRRQLGHRQQFTRVTIEKIKSK